MAKKTRCDNTLTFYSADNWVLMRFIETKLAEIQGRIEDPGLKQELKDLAHDFDHISTQFEAMYRRVGDSHHPGQPGGNPWWLYQYEDVSMETAPGPGY